jgi:hypothetical protein
MPRLIKFLIFHGFIGFAVALACIVMIMALNLSGLRSLLQTSDIKWVALSAFTALMTITHASVAMGIAVMRLPYVKDEDESGPRGGNGSLVNELARLPLLVLVKISRKR